MKTWKTAALTGALLWGACSKEPASTPEAPAPKPVPQATAPAPKPEAEPQAEEPAPATEPEPVADTGAPPEFKIGQKREEVMALFGKCAERRAFVPAAPGALYVEIYQPKKSEECLKRLGERNFTIRGGVLYQINPGIYPPDAPPGSFTPPKDV